MATHVPVYEYYDGYEDEDDRPVIKYIVLGTLNNGKSVVICYVDKYSFVSTIGSKVHEKAWTTSQISIHEAKKFVRNKLESPNEYVSKIERLRRKKETLDKQYSNISIAISRGNIRFHCYPGESYTDKYIAALQRQIEVIHR